MRHLSSFLIAFIIFITTTFYACRPRSGSELAIGVISAETGDGAPDGKLQHQGSLLAQEEINIKKMLKKKGTLDLTFFDSQSKEQMDRNELNEGISLDHIQCFVGDVYSGLTKSMIPIINQEHVFLISPWAGAADLSNCSPFFARNYPTCKFEAQFAASYGINTLHSKRIAIAYLNSDWGNSLDKYFKSETDSLGGNIVLNEGYESSEPNLGLIVTRIKSTNPDLVYLGGYETDMGNISKLMKEQNLNVQVIANTNYFNAACLKIAQKSANGVLIPSPDYDPENSDVPSVKNFYRLYQSHFPGAEPTFLEAKAYDAVMLIKDAYNAVGADPVNIAKYIRNLKIYNGASGVYSFTSGDVNTKIILKKVLNGKVVTASD